MKYDRNFNERKIKCGDAAGMKTYLLFYYEVKFLFHQKK